MAFCKKCGAYIPIGDTACPACGYDPEEEERQAKEQQEREEAEARRKKEAEEAAEKARKERERREQQQKARAEQERKREEQRQKWNQSHQGQGYAGGAAQSQYASQQTGRTEEREERTGWTPPWQESQSQSSSYYTTYAKNKAQAKDSAANQRLSVLSYIGPLFLIPLFSRPNDDFARFHVGQGLNLFLLNGLLTLLGNSSGLIPLAGSVFSIYCMIKGIGNVLKGKKEPLPLIGKFKLFR